jgi:acetyl esterase/lipase/lysophospholipase L1-like esterase
MVRDFLAAVSASFVIFCGGQSATAQRSYPPKINDARSEVYKTIDEVELKVWIFEPENHQATDQRPAVVFFFGGGWRGGSPEQFAQHCRYLAKQGMVAMTADYRVLSRHKTLALQCVEDAKSAVRWIRTNAARLGIDPDRIVAGGGSAGGHIAACTGVISGLGEDPEDSKISSRPNAMALFNPALILAPYKQDEVDSEAMAAMKSRAGVEPELISPIHQVQSEAPPTIIFHGIADTTVPFVTAERYAEVAAAAGNRCELVAYPGAGHGFFNYGREGVPGEYFQKTVHRLHRFLQSLEYLDHDPGFRVPASTNVHLRSDLDHSRRVFEKEGKGTVAFMGGSITENPGYRDRVSEYLRKRFPETEFEFIAAGISSTCSTTGAFRLQRDVLAHDPDLFFVEFAVNDDQDAAHARRECIRGMEGIIRHAKTHAPAMDIVVTHFVNPPILETLQQGRVPVSVNAHERVASRYGVASIGVAQEVAERISDEKLTWKEYGGTHPKPAGYQLTADLMIDLLETAWASPLAETPPESARLVKAIDPASYASGRLVPVTAAKTDEQWIHEQPDWKAISGAVRGRFENRKLLCAQAIGATMTLDFEGTAIGLYVLAGPDAGVVEYSIDGGTFEAVDLYHRFSAHLHYPRTAMLAADLKPGEHHLILRVGKDRNTLSQGNAIRILDFTAN